MRKRRVLALLMTASVLVSTVSPSPAVSAAGMDNAQDQQTSGEEDSQKTDEDSPVQKPDTGDQQDGGGETLKPDDKNPADGQDDLKDPAKPEETGPGDAQDKPDSETPAEDTQDPEEETEGSGEETENGKTDDTGEQENDAPVQEPEIPAEEADGTNYLAEPRERELLMDLDFENLQEGETITSNEAEAKGNYTLTDSYSGGGKALHLDGSSSQFLTVTDADGGSLLTGVKELTVSYEARHDRDGANWVMYASNSGAAPTYQKERYIGVLQQDGKLTAERYNNNGPRPASANAPVSNDWVHVDVVLTETDTTVYVNGSEVSRVDSAHTVDGILGDSSILQIGKANWGSGEYFQGSIDNFRLYSYALSEAEIEEQFQEYVDRGTAGEYEGGLTLNAGYISEDLVLPTEFEGAQITWTSDQPEAVTNEGKVTRTEENQAVTLTAEITDGEKVSRKEFPLVVLAAGQDVLTYVSDAPAVGQKGGMKLAAETGDGYMVLHKDQPVLYTAKGAKAFVSPQIFRKADGTFGVIAADGGNSGSVLIYDSEDLITYTNEKVCSLPGVTSIAKLACVYDMAGQEYRIFAENAGGRCYVATTKDFEEFTQAQSVSYKFEEIDGMQDAIWESSAALTQAEYDRLVKKFTNPSLTSLSGLPGAVTLQAGEDLEETLKMDPVTATYSDGTVKKLSIRWNAADLEKIDTRRPGTYTLHGTVGGSAYYTEAEAPLIPERADPFITYNEDDGYYYFTASYPMMRSGDPEGYDRLVLRRAETISGLADAEEVTIWDERESGTLGRFIWAPELHKIGDYWYFVSTAGLNSGTGTTFNIRPFMIRCNNGDDMMNPDSWGEPELVKTTAEDKNSYMDAMSLDMTYFEAGGSHYLAWADITRRNSSIAIAKIDPADPTQLISRCAVISGPEYTWELVNNRVDEGPAVLQRDGKVYLAFSASGTGSEYCVGLLTGDADSDLTDPENWTKTPYPILTSTDFDNEVSGPGHNSFTVDENGNPVIVYHARPYQTHSTAGGVHNGDPLFDPCRHCYVKPVFFDSEGMPVLNQSDEEFAGAEGSVFSVQLTIEGEAASSDPILEYRFDEHAQAGTVLDSVSGNNAEISKGASYVQDKQYGQVLYLDGGTAVGGSNSFLEFPEGFFDGKDNLTISMDVKEVTRSGNYFTFTIGQDDQKYLFLKTMPTGMKLAITKESYNDEKTASKNFKYPNNSRTWINVKMVITKNSISLYQDGKLMAQNANTGLALSDLGTNLKAYLGKSFYSDDIYFRGYFDNVKVYDWAMTDDEVKTFTEQDAAARKAAMEDLQHVADSFEIPNADAVKGNITLPSEKDGVSIQWTSSDEKIVSTAVVKNDGYDDTPAGVVTRQSADASVTLTAEFSKDGASVVKTYNLTVKAAPKPVSEKDYIGYLFVRFTDTEENGTKEQTYFSASEDGFHWENLNGGKAVLTSTIGESGLRDHYIARTAEGDKFYMIATDLSIAHNRSWAEAGSNGSHSIVVWESDDLVNWSEPWLAEIAPEGAGCTWAPEFIYDEKTGEYVVYWSATTLKVDENENIVEDYENHAIYYCKTRDFRTFTDAKLYHKGEGVKVIDSTMIEHDGTYYRYTKNESIGSIAIDKSDSVLGTFTDIASDTLSNQLPAQQGAVEGPIIFKLNDRTEEGKEQWCLLVDRFARGQGYYPLVTDDLESGEFRMLSGNEFSMPGKFRHGYVMPVTEEEYTALQHKWGDPNYGYIDEDDFKTLDKSTAGNPMLGFDADGNILYGGDPSILVDGDTVYCYVGRDTAAGEYYQMPGWYCYSSKDMVNWTFEGETLRADRAHITWAKDDVSAWAGQVAKGSDGKYYFYYCTETISAYGGGKSIGVAVSDSPTGPFEDIGHPLVRNTDTYNGVHTWEDIDPTIWIEKDDEGVEHRYLGWGNTRFFVCELNEDMISVKDRDGDPNRLSCGYASDGTFDIVVGKMDGNGVGAENKVWFDGHFFTEAPYYYRQQDENGNYYGPYYMFFACDWREQMAYATTDDIMSNEWEFGGILMEPSATANTNHMAVFDFQGETYFVYHDGSLPHGSGFRRVACVERFKINSDGTIDPIRKTATGLNGTISYITDKDGNYLAIKDFENTLNDADYPIRGKELTVEFFKNGHTAEWVLRPGKADAGKDEYVSIESNAKPGLYLCVGDPAADGTIPLVLSQDAGGTTEEAARMTFRTLKGVSGDGVRLESVQYPGYFLVFRDGKLLAVRDAQEEEGTIYVSTDESMPEVPTDPDQPENPDAAARRSVLKTVRFYTAGETLETDDIRIQMVLDNGKTKQITDYTTNADEIDMTAAGGKTLTVTWDYQGRTYTDQIGLCVVEEEYREQ